MASYDPSLFSDHLEDNGNNSMMMLENLGRSDDDTSFYFQINIFRDYFPSDFHANNDQSSSSSPPPPRIFPFFVDFINMTSQNLAQGFPQYLQQNLSDFLCAREMQILSSQVMSYTNSLLINNDDDDEDDEDDDDDHPPPRVFPVIVEIAVVSSNNDDDDEDEDEDRGDLDMIVMDRVAEASMREFSMTTPTSEEAIASLKKVEEISAEMCSERCNVCLEDFERGDDISGMPCDHVFHSDCIVGWLKISYTCPLCRFQMPRQY